MGEEEVRWDEEKMKLQVNPSSDWHVTGQRKRKDGWDKKRRVGGTNRKGKEEGCDREMVARQFPEPAAELIYLGTWRSGELCRGVSGSGKVFYGSPAGLRHALALWTLQQIDATLPPIRSEDLANRGLCVFVSVFGPWPSLAEYNPKPSVGRLLDSTRCESETRLILNSPLTPHVFTDS